jgi:hypothetical protein
MGWFKVFVDDDKKRKMSRIDSETDFRCSIVMNWLRCNIQSVCFSRLWGYGFKIFPFGESPDITRTFGFDQTVSKKLFPSAHHHSISNSMNLL